MATDVAGRVDRDRLGSLEAERAFLLESLRDLDAEWTAGDVDEHDYVTLRDGYTKRAADVLRQIEAGKAKQSDKAAVPWSRRIAVVAGVIAVAVLAGWLVARSSGQRLPGQEVTGDAPGDDIAVTLSQARRLSFTDPQRAIELYGEVLAQRPDHAESLTYRGWLIFLVGRSAPEDEQPGLVSRAREDLDAAVAADSSYPDPLCFMAIIADNYDDDQATALEHADECLALNPPADLRALMDPYVETLTPETTDN